MRVDFGFFNAIFRPSCVFHSRVFSYPSVDTNEQSTGSCPNFYQTFKMLWQIFRADNVFVRFYGPISLLYKQLLQYTLLKYITVPSALLNKFPKKFHVKPLAPNIVFTKLSTKKLLLWRCHVSFEYRGLLQNTPASFLLLLSMLKLRCKRHYRNLATYSWCTTWREHVTKTAPARRRHSVGGGGAAAHSSTIAT